MTASVIGVATPASFNLTNLAGTATSIAVTSGSPQSVTVTNAFANLVATVTDAFGNPVSGASVAFAAPTGTVPSATLGSSPVLTGSNGQVSETATANTHAGSYSVTATVAGVVTPATFSLTNVAGAAAAVTATSGTPQSTNVSTAFANLVATVTDQFGNLVPGRQRGLCRDAESAAGCQCRPWSSTPLTTDSNGHGFEARRPRPTPSRVVTRSQPQLGRLPAATFNLDQRRDRRRGRSLLGDTDFKQRHGWRWLRLNCDRRGCDQIT